MASRLCHNTYNYKVITCFDSYACYLLGISSKLDKLEFSCFFFQGCT